MVDLSRETALKIVYDINENHAYSNVAVNRHLEASGLGELDRAFVTDIVYGTIRWKMTLDWIIEQFSSVKLKKISPWILNILRIGIYQLLFSDRVPDSAACNESVKLSKEYGHAASSRFVNAVLRNVSRNKGNITYPDKNSECIRHLSLKFSHPDWLVKKWVELFGEEFTESLLAANNEIPDFTVRVNTLKIGKEELIENLRQEGVEASGGRYLEEAVTIKNPTFALKTDSFKKGYFQVQDESSMLAVKILDPKPGEFVMDVCSAPGGKASHIAQLMKNTGTVLARDVHEHKIKLIDETCERLGLSAVRTELFDALVLDDKHVEKADRVLVDAPCTGFGIIRRRPDIKWARKPENIKDIVLLQRNILKTCARYVKPGGILVYSTCTINPEENEGIVQDFLGADRSFEPDDITQLLPEKLKKRSVSSASTGYVQLFPCIDGVDGFFIARMKKVKVNG